jgi:hypothetical protein
MLKLGLMEIRLVSASRLHVESYRNTFSAFGRRTFDPRPQDGVFRCGFNKFKMIEEVFGNEGDGFREVRRNDGPKGGP